MPTRRQTTAMLAATALFPHAGRAQEPDFLELQRAIVISDPNRFFDALATIQQRGTPDMAAGLILAMRYTRGPQAAISDVLAAITGESAAKTWFDWMLWQEATPEVVPHPSYIDFKRALFLQIDENFDVFLRREYLDPAAMRIRLEEIVWGGVLKDGIPSLDKPDLIAAQDAAYMRDDDLVFGVSINGDARAYPLRIMGWHEMFNDVIGGVPVALAYCTLCGSGILFETDLDQFDAPLVFGSSGFLYRSNKLMFDRTTHSLWNQFTGRPVSGQLVNSGIALHQRPVVIETWKDWRTANPQTQVLAVETGFKRDYGSGVVYRDYFASDALMFPTHVDQSRNKQKDYVFGVRQFGGAKAWPLSALKGRAVINDGLLGRPLVLIGNAATRSVRAYERADLVFSGDLKGLSTADGVTWRITEDALLAEDGRSLPRVAGHIAYWFAWNGYLGVESEPFEG